MDRNNVIIKYLQSKGYEPATDYYSNIANWKEWYNNNVEKFHTYYDEDGTKRTMYRLGMAKKGCEDWSSILFTEKDSMICDKEENQKYLDEALKELHFNDIIPENIEKGFWSGTLGTLVRIKDAIIEKGQLKADKKTKRSLINITADSIIPLRVENGEIVDVAFVSKTTIENKNIYYIEIHELVEDGYKISNKFVNEQGNEVKKEGVLEEYYTHSFVPLFSLLSPSIVNNIENNNGLGISIYGNAIDQLKGVDNSYHNAQMDTVLGGKKVFYNKSLIKYETITYLDEEGNEATKEVPIYPDDITKQQFKLLDGDMGTANDETLLHEYNPDLRVADNELNITLNLNLVALKMGLGKGFYRFENGTVVTATQYLGENKDLVDNAKKHRNKLNEYTVGIARALLLLGRILYNQKVDENDNISLTNKDGFLISEEELQQQYRQDFQAGLMSKKTYLMKARGMSEQDAIKELEEIKKENPSVKELIGGEE